MSSITPSNGYERPSRRRMLLRVSVMATRPARLPRLDHGPHTKPSRTAPSYWAGVRAVIVRVVPPPRTRCAQGVVQHGHEPRPIRHEEVIRPEDRALSYQSRHPLASTLQRASSDSRR